MNAREMLLTPRQFLLIGGGVLIVLGTVGFFGVIGPTPAKSVFGNTWWFDNGENWAHLLLGIVGVAAGLTLNVMLRRALVLVLGVVGVVVGIYSIFRSPFLGANLENPADTILHIAVGAWALASSIPKMTGMPATGTTPTTR